MEPTAPNQEDPPRKPADGQAEAPGNDRGTTGEDDLGEHPRCTEEEAAARTELCHKLLCAGTQKSVRNAVFCKTFGETSPRQIERYVSRAREILIAESQRSTGEHRGETLGFLERVIGDSKEKMVIRLRALEHKTKLLALALPQKHEVTGKLGVEHSGTIEITKVIADLRRAMVEDTVRTDEVRQEAAKLAALHELDEVQQEGQRWVQQGAAGEPKPEAIDPAQREVKPPESA